MTNETRNFKPMIHLVLALYFLIGFSTLAWGDRAAGMLFDEDRYFENVGAVSLFVASVICAVAFFRARKTHKQTGMFWVKQLVYLGLALLFFFGAGEEISWGQRIFGIAQPQSLLEQNVQDELNIHNLAIFESSYLLRADTLFTAFCLVFTVLIPFASLRFAAFRRSAEKWTPIAHWGIGALFLFNYACAGASKFVFSSYYTYAAIPFVQALQEIKESNYETLFILLAVNILWDLASLSRSSSRA